ncbi:MAG: Tn3 family transposase [Chloroflexota bacterium]|jgi:TnpA family transposase|nr:Tn3 family transposase [Chloroflexota bacterium]
MPTREVLLPAQRSQFTDIPTEISERDLVRYYTFSPVELAVIHQRRRDHNRLGFAVQLAYLRFPGRPLRAGEEVPNTILSYIAAQLQIDPTVFVTYGERDTTRREHLIKIQQHFGFRPFNRSTYRELAMWLLPTALSTDNGIALVTAVVEEMRLRKIIAPALYVIERVAWETRDRAQQQIYKRLTTDLTVEQCCHLDSLLTTLSSQPYTRLAWLRQPVGKPVPATILKLIERLRFIRSIGIDHDRAQHIHQNQLLKLAREGTRYTPQFLQRFEPTRRYATLVAFLVEAAASLTDHILDMHDRVMTHYLRKSEHVHAEHFQKSGKAINEKVRLYANIGKALIAARETAQDPYDAIQTVVPWETFVQTVAEAEHLAQPADFDYLDHLDAYYTQIRRYAPVLLETFTFKGTTSSRSLLQALALLKQMNAQDLKKVRPGAPMAFVKPRWENHVCTTGGIDRHYYELCALNELRNGLRSGDIWVEGSRQFKAFDAYLVPNGDWQYLKQVGDVPLAIPTDVHAYLTERRHVLHAALTKVDTLLAHDQLADVKLRNGSLSIKPLEKAVPEAVEALITQAYSHVPWVKITDLLVEIDRITQFSRHFTHLHTGVVTKDKGGLFAAILADATNLGLSKMANACPGMSYQSLSWIMDWYVRDDTYRKALAELVNFQHRLPLARYWGDGTTSSSDAQRFPVGGRREAMAQVNARYGHDLSMMFYTHVSDQYAPFHVKAISATAHQAPYVLDGLLYHETDLQIQEHYTDTGGVTDHLFGLCPPLGFRFAPRIRDLGDRRLYTIAAPSLYPRLNSLIGGTIQVRRIEEHWDELLRLMTSIRRGTVTASLMMRKLAAYPRQNGLALALREMGRIERTLYALEWFQNVDLRRRVTIGLNKGEAKNALARAVFFNRRGVVQDRSYEDQRNRASGLNLVLAAIILWNTLALEEAISMLQTQGKAVVEAHLEHLAPLGWEKIILTGEYRWSLRHAGVLQKQAMQMGTLKKP